MNIKHLIATAIIGILFIVSTGSRYSSGLSYEKDAVTSPLLTFNMRTVTAGGPYSPKHVLAIWVEDSAGVFVKTRKLRANSRKQHLVAWAASSNYNVVDAITGSTLTSHTSHTVTWDCKDVNGNLVPDGQYYIKAEFTERNSANSGQADGPVLSIPFIKGDSSVTVNIPDELYFKDISYTFVPDISTGSQSLQTFSDPEFRIYPNPFRSELHLELVIEEPSMLRLYAISMQGGQVFTIFDGIVQPGNQKFKWNTDAYDLAEGLFLLVAEDDVQRLVQRVIKIK